MDKKLNGIFENLIPMKIINYTVQYLLLHSNKSVNICYTWPAFPYGSYWLDQPCFMQSCYKVENTMDLQHFLPCCNLVTWL